MTKDAKFIQTSTNTWQDAERTLHSLSSIVQNLEKYNQEYVHGGFLTADPQPLPREFVSEVYIKMFEDEYSSVTTLSFAVSHSRHTTKEYIAFHSQPVEGWHRNTAFLDYFAWKIEFRQKP